MGYHVYLQHAYGTLVCWHIKIWFDSGSVTAKLNPNFTKINQLGK